MTVAFELFAFGPAAHKDFLVDGLFQAGHASEKIKFGDETTGASNDITQATGLLKQYVERFGFDKEMGMLDLVGIRQCGACNILRWRPPPGPGCG